MRIDRRYGGHRVARQRKYMIADRSFSSCSAHGPSLTKLPHSSYSASRRLRKSLTWWRSLTGSDLASPRMSVLTETPYRAEIECIGASPCATSTAARASSSACSLSGRPTRTPRARAAASPARVLSLIRLRSNSASAPMMWNSNRPVADCVSMASQSDTNLIDLRSISATMEIR